MVDLKPKSRFYIGLTILLVYFLGIHTTLSKHIEFTDEVVEIEWSKLKAGDGYPIRIQNLSDKPIKTLAARLKPGQGLRLSDRDFANLKIDFKLSCHTNTEGKNACDRVPICSTTQGTCVIGRLQDLGTGASGSNFFPLKAHGDPPSKPIKLLVSIKTNETPENHLTRTFTILPPSPKAAEVKIETKLIPVDSYRFFGRNCILGRCWLGSAKVKEEIDTYANTVENTVEKNGFILQQEGKKGDLEIALKSSDKKLEVLIEHPEQLLPGEYKGVLKGITGPSGKPITSTASGRRGVNKRRWRYDEYHPSPREAYA